MNGINWNILDPATKKVWRLKGIVIFGLIWLFTAVPTIGGWFYTAASDPNRDYLILILIIVSISILIIFLIYNTWIYMYYPRYSYALVEEGILINRGIWWKYRRTIPYSRIQHISIDQGPFEQIFGIYRVNSYTAGTGSMGGASAGSNITGPEGQILGVRNPQPLKENIMRQVMKYKLGNGITDINDKSVSIEILEELRDIKKVLERK